MSRSQVRQRTQQIQQAARFLAKFARQDAAVSTLVHGGRIDELQAEALHGSIEQDMHDEVENLRRAFLS